MGGGNIVVADVKLKERVSLLQANQRRDPVVFQREVVKVRQVIKHGSLQGGKMVVVSTQSHQFGELRNAWRRGGSQKNI